MSSLEHAIDLTIVRGPRLLVVPRVEEIEEHVGDTPDIIPLGQSEGGIQLAAFATDRRPACTMGRVVKLGDDPICPHCQKGRPFEVEPGDVIVFAPTAGEFIYPLGERLLILQHTDVLAVVEPKQENVA